MFHTPISSRIDGGQILHLLFWLLPTLSTVAFIRYSVSRRVGLPGSWAMLIGSIVDIFTVNLDSCIAGDCTTKNPIKIAFGVFLLPHIWVLIASTFGLQIATSTRDEFAVPSEPKSSTVLD